MRKRFFDLSQLAGHLAAKLAQEIPPGWCLEAGVQAEDAGYPGYVLVHLAGPVKPGTYTGWEPGPGQVKLLASPCPDRGTACPYLGRTCTGEDEPGCRGREIRERLAAAFAASMRHPDDPVLRYVRL